MDGSNYYIGLGGQLVNRDLEQMGHQSFFLRTLIEEIPEVLDGIKEIYFEFEAICDSLGKERNKSLLLYTIEDINATQSIKKQIEDWAKRWYINEEWIFTYLFQTFMVWYENEKMKFNIIMFNSAVGNAREILQKEKLNEKIELPRYNPILQTEKEYREKVEKLISSHIKRTNQEFEENGYICSKEKKTNEHYTWLVYYHVLGWTFDEIADQFFKNKAATVRKEVNYIYEVIGINKDNRKKR
ncbi:hypothetical protein [Neobacillus sp. DY30]|uniref:hypothetical protein n=1 Tax=Neobacillus sp. DY30 TaxID=3047871 RepID=UPI0024BF4F6E|nr:hypothetical protein [Neobacillus sp. DY30]WHY01355.1 hypothetical protein QNH29_03630 [Neobacillus sp. DY30]